MIDCFASLPHFLRHLRPIWEALDESERGKFYVRKSLAEEAEGIPNLMFSRPQGAGPIMVASYADLQAVRRRPIVLVEHGSGQGYRSRPDHPSYPGGRGREAVGLFICPNDSVAKRNLDAYPAAQVAVVGCPALDRWYQWPTPPLPAGESVAATAFHWAAEAVAPEAGTAFPYFASGVRELASRMDVMGHAHPRIFARMAPALRRLGATPNHSLDAVFEKASVLLVDNSSAGFEAMALGRPVVWLSPPWYRRDVHHGLRFWSALRGGVHCEDPADLVAAVEKALEDPPEIRAGREEIAQEVYGSLDGKASSRAAEAIREFSVARL